MCFFGVFFFVFRPDCYLKGHTVVILICSVSVVVIHHAITVETTDLGIEKQRLVLFDL